jgi:hypothetical protein
MTLSIQTKSFGVTIHNFGCVRLLTMAVAMCGMLLGHPCFGSGLLPPGQTGNLLNMTNGNVYLQYDLTTGQANFYWQNSLNITAQVSGGNLTLNWPADHTGWRLQAQTNDNDLGLGTNWFDVSNSTATNAFTIPINQNVSGVFYRLIFP